MEEAVDERRTGGEYVLASVAKLSGMHSAHA